MTDAIAACPFAPVHTLPRNLPSDNGHLGRFAAILQEGFLPDHVAG